VSVETSVLVDIPALLPSWQRSLRAARRSPRTVQSYTEAAEQLSDFLVRKGMPTLVASIRREHVESFIEDLDRRFKPATVGVRFRSLQQLMRWMLEEGEITADPMARMRPPKVPEDPPAVLSDTELRGLLRAAEGDRRDTALLRVFIDTGARLSEVAGLWLADVDLDDGTLGVLGKGERVRVLPIGVKTIKALDRYLRVRRRDDVDALWLGGKGAMTPSGITQMLRRRALQAGIGHIHPHQFRHTIRVRDHLSFGDGATGHGEGLAAFEHGGEKPRTTVVAGEVAAVRGLAYVRIGDDLGAQRGGSRRDRFAPPTLESVVVPADPRDGAHLRAALTRLAEQGPLIDVRVSDVDGQASVSLYGQVQKEVIQATLVRDFGIEVAFRRVTQLHVERPLGVGTAIEPMHAPTNPYNATIGRRIEPATDDSGIAFRLDVDHRSMPLFIYGTADEFASSMHGYVRDALGGACTGGASPTATSR
jgi:site-specific recombinase XerC